VFENVEALFEHFDSSFEEADLDGFFFDDLAEVVVVEAVSFDDLE